MFLLDKFRKKTKKKIEKKVEKKVKPEQKIEKKAPTQVRRSGADSDQSIGGRDPDSKDVGKTLPKKIIGKQTPRIYQVIKEPHITEKATFLTEQDKYVFRISSKANKTETKKAIESLYGVKVKKVSIIHLPSKKRRLGRSEGWRHGLKKGFKKAIVTLKKGEKIELMPK